MKKSTQRVLRILSIGFLLAAAVIFAMLVRTDVKHPVLIIGISGVCAVIGVAIMVITGFFSGKLYSRPENEREAKRAFISNCIGISMYAIVLYFITDIFDNKAMHLLLFSAVIGVQIRNTIDSYKLYRSFRKK